MILQWADSHFCAAHHADGGWHGHTWRVRVYWPYEGENICERKAALAADIAQVDHTELLADLSRAEDLAAWFGNGLKACRVDVWRDAEGMGATWRA